jgi:hypothetical protein
LGVAILDTARLAARWFISYLENGSNTYHGETNRSMIPLKVCESVYYSINAEKADNINELIRNKAQGRDPGREELLAASNLAPYEDMHGVNGVFSNNSIYIRSPPSDEGKVFVARHELDHAFQTAHVGDECANKEYCATMHAASEYPSGFVDTVISSLIMACDSTADKQCFLFNSWRIFRYYILP